MEGMELKEDGYTKVTKNHEGHEAWKAAPQILKITSNFLDSSL